MAVVAYSKTRSAQHLHGRAPQKSPPSSAPRRQPPSGDLINAILQYADLQQDMGGGRVLLRLSPRRMADPVIAGPLGREAGRLAEVSIIWDEREEEIFRILDGAGSEVLTLAGAAAQADEPDEPEFDLTPAALAYLAAHGKA